ncbi:MAG: SusC/RagA family TonB-linked outer membrane protein [Mediterranea sp.]|jgi:TonB-linked SusC/RagA family outer membrane protein|nr:SusC/RagA family TonB-linked outer membrane protein [Mediterranea sp.]
MENNFTIKEASKLCRALLILLLTAIPPQWTIAQASSSTGNYNLRKAIEQIQATSKYKFFYDDKLGTLSVNEVSVKGAPLEEVLNKLLKDKEISYRIVDNIVYLQEKNAAAAVRQAGDGRTLTGQVRDANSEPLIGVSVRVKGTTDGGITDMDGNYRVTTKQSNPILIFSYVGYRTQEVAVRGDMPLDIVMEDDAQALQEVVVTALGIKRETKALSYNAQQVNAADITGNKTANFINSLSGKAAGVVINSSSSGVGGAARVVMRGTKSILQSSNALYVIDGVPMYASTQSQGTEFASRGTSEPIADLNPEDIESMTVLTGAAAAALYGSDAANGAIVITTKKGQEGKLSLTVNSTTNLMSPFVMPKFQNRYGTGSALSENNIDKSYGPLLNSANYMGYDPQSDYLRTGVTATENISLSVGTERNQTYASASATNSNGIVPNNRYDRYNFNFRNTTSFLRDRMTLDVSAGYVYQRDRNMINQGTYGNPLVGAYLYPRGNDWEDARMYKQYDPSRNIYTQNWKVGDATMVMQNPYWVNYLNLRENSKDRYMLSASLSYDITDWMSVSGRIRSDNSTADYTQKYYATTNNQLTGGSDRGFYGIMRYKDKQLYADALLSINKNFAERWSLAANLGASYSDIRYDALEVSGPITDSTMSNNTGERVGLTNEFSVQNISQLNRYTFQSGWRQQVQSIYGSAELGYRSAYYLTLTGRNDWPSQLAGPRSDTKSYFYYSAGLSVLVSETLKMPENFHYLKLRGSYASVGNAFQRYISNPGHPLSNGQYSITTDYPTVLKPERTESFEIGITARFLKHFSLDATYYNAVTKNQTLESGLSSSSGSSNIYVQTGKVRNSGFEVSLGYGNRWKDYSWNSNFTFSTNRNKILELVENAYIPEHDIYITKDDLDMGGLGQTRFWLTKGGSMGDLYSLIDLKRYNDGTIFVDQSGNVATANIDDKSRYIKLGSVLPKANMAWRNTLSYRNFDLGFMVSARLGGIVFSRTQAILDEYGVSEASASARDRGYVAINGGADRINPEQWYSVVASGTAVPQYYTYSATNVRLQEASIGYRVPRKWLGGACDLNISIVGRNLWMLYNKAPFDPESVASTGSFYQGIDYFMMPSLRNIGLNVSLKF